MRKDFIFAADIDNTLIHSYKNARQGGICVEKRDRKEVSFISPEALELLRIITEKCLVIPITTRSAEQYRRINFGFSFKYAIAAHGALLFKDGIIDESWLAETKRKYCRRLPLLKEDGNIYDIRNVEDTFIFAKMRDRQKALSFLNDFVFHNEFDVFTVNNKLYIFPKEFNKGTALMRLRRLLNPLCVLCAGDSILDVPMLELADVSYAPIELPLKKRCIRIDADSDFNRDLLKRVLDTIEHVTRGRF